MTLTERHSRGVTLPVTPAADRLTAAARMSGMSAFWEAERPQNPHQGRARDSPSGGDHDLLPILTEASRRLIQSSRDTAGFCASPSAGLLPAGRCSRAAIVEDTLSMRAQEG